MIRGKVFCLQNYSHTSTSYKNRYSIRNQTSCDYTIQTVFYLSKEGVEKFKNERDIISGRPLPLVIINRRKIVQFCTLLSSRD